MTDLIGGAVGLAVLAALGWWLYRKGKKTERQRAEEAAQEMKEQINDAIDASHAGGAAWHVRLRQHNDGMRDEN